MRKRVLMAMLGAGLMSGQAVAATNPADVSVNGDSTGDLTVFLTVPDLIKISGLADITMSGSTGDWTGSDGVCVYRNGAGNYAVTATGGNGAATFELQDGAGSAIPYAVEWSDGTTTETLTTGTTSTNTFVGDPSATDCGGVDNATINVTAAAADVQAASPSTHDEVVTVVVSPM